MIIRKNTHSRIFLHTTSHFWGTACRAVPTQVRSRDRRQPVAKMSGRMIFLLLAISAFCLSGCEPDPSEYQEACTNPEFLHSSMQLLTDVMVDDITSPPVASRFYAYPSIAGYEAMRHGYPGQETFAGQLTDLNPVPEPETGQSYCFPAAGVIAFLRVGTKMNFSEEEMKAFEANILDGYKKAGVPTSVLNRSIEYGDRVAAHILAWANGDNYNQTRTDPKFNVLTEEVDRWKPTPPKYMEAIEPSWNRIRPFVMDSATQFVPEPPTPFDMKKGSKFYEEVIEVYDAVAKAKEEHIAIASFWDCNPYVAHVVGHVGYATKKITPGGHWMGISSIACRKTNADAMKSMKTFALVSISLADAFISCWDEKYRSNLIRPETVINEYMDPNWKPTLQTPPFPEYTSGHSVISSAAAIMLTNLYGENFDFVDTTEVRYGLPARSFNSFIQASEEAAVSRLYGGIHYRPAIDNGVTQGRAVGRYIVGKLDL